MARVAAPISRYGAGKNAAIQPPNKTLFWVQIETEKGRDKLAKMIVGCR
jgi:hypothetical protein